MKNASNAKVKTEIAQEKEGLELAVVSSKMENLDTLEITKEKLEDAIKNQFGENKDFAVTDNRDGSFIVNMNDTKRMYYVDEEQVISQENILKISTAEELKEFRDDVNSGNTYDGWYVYLANDITLDINEEWEPIGTYLNENTSIMDKTNKPFMGIFDGKNHYIDGLRITSKEKGKGLFGLIKEANIKNLNIEKNCDIDAGVVVGAIVGYANSNTILENCHNKSNITSNSRQVGGIAGQNGANCFIINCSNTGNINALSDIGGIVGINYGDVRSCYNSGKINATTTCVGGITGTNNGIINSCYNTNDISGSGTNCGGIVGLMQSDKTAIFNSYNIGNIIAENTSSGGIVGVYVDGTVQNCYYLENIVNGGNENNKVDGVTSKTSEELKKLSTKLGEYFKEDTNNINNGYPILQWQ